jgi:hypothetical protein
MNAEFYNRISKGTAHRKSRDDNKNYVFQNPNYLSDLVEIACNTKDKNHHKACWILELICEERLELFIPFIDKFCEALPHFKVNPAIRPTSKICLFLTKSKKVTLTENQEEKIIETCLDHLIDVDLAATAAYSMRALFELGKKHSWVNEELKSVLSRDLHNQSPGYCFAVKDILKRLK